MMEKAYSAWYDHLTGSAILFHRLGVLIRADRSGSLVGLMVLDLDHFKLVNDTFASAGDLLLKQVAGEIE